MAHGTDHRAPTRGGRRSLTLIPVRRGPCHGGNSRYMARFSTAKARIFTSSSITSPDSTPIHHNDCLYASLTRLHGDEREETYYNTKALEDFATGL